MAWRFALHARVVALEVARLVSDLDPPVDRHRVEAHVEAPVRVHGRPPDPEPLGAPLLAVHHRVCDLRRPSVHVAPPPHRTYSSAISGSSATTSAWHGEQSDEIPEAPRSACHSTGPSQTLHFPSSQSIYAALDARRSASASVSPFVQFRRPPRSAPSPLRLKPSSRVTSTRYSISDFA